MHYMGGTPDDGWEGTVERLMDPNSPQVYGTLAAHMLETEKYIKEHLRDRALVITYEEMSADLPAVLDRLAKFLNVALPTNRLDAITERVSFSTMSALGGAVGNMLTRKGEPGDWRNHFTINQNTEFEEFWKSLTAGSKLAELIDLDT